MTSSSKRKVLAVADELDRRSIELIRTKINCAQQALEVVPKGMNPEESVLYVKGCVDALAEYKWLEQQFWHDAFIKHSFDKTAVIHIDIDSGEFYTLND